MPTLHEIISCIENEAPLAFQESYDNAGLITGMLNWECTGALLTLDCTEEVVWEAQRKNCNLIITHHPILFKSIKRLSGNDYVTRTLTAAIKNDIAIYAAHTNADNVHHGVNQMICSKLGIKHTTTLQSKKGLLRKLVVFVPGSHRDKVAEAVFSAGAGVIGNYDSCSFNSEGYGTFRAGEGANPFVGKKNEVHREPEVRFEAIYPHHLENKIIQSLKASHPYEEPAFDLIPMENTWHKVGSGLIGQLEHPLSVEDWLAHVQEVFSLSCIRFTENGGKKIQTVAVCGGSGSFLIRDALAAGCDAFLTADVKYHEFFDAEGKMMITDIGHFESEKFTPELFGVWIQKKFINFAVHFSETRTNPVKYFVA